MYSSTARCIERVDWGLIRRNLVAVVVLLCIALPATAQPAKSKTASYVKVRAIAHKPNEAGHQKVTIFLEVDEKYFLIGNKVPVELEPLRFRLKFMVHGKPAEAEITYPSGKIEKDRLSGDYTIYEGKVACRGTIRREVGDTSPVEIIITMQGYPKQRTH